MFGFSGRPQHAGKALLNIRLPQEHATNLVFLKFSLKLETQVYVTEKPVC